MTQKHNPKIWIGTWSMGGEGFGPQDLSESLRTLEIGFDLGFTHFDTANIYGKGNSETLLGKAFENKKNKVFISSKGGITWEGNRFFHDASPKGLESQLLDSLKRLKSDCLDLYSLHWPDKNIRIPESLNALESFKKKGLIKDWGISNFSCEQITQYIPKQSKKFHQVHFNPVVNNSDVLKTGTQDKRCINCTYSPFEQGMLLDPEKVLTKNDKRNKLKTTLKTKAKTEKEILNWIFSHQEVSSVIVGPRNKKQIESLYKILKNL